MYSRAGRGVLADLFGPGPLFKDEQLYQLSAPPIQAFEQRHAFARPPLRPAPPQSHRSGSHSKKLARIETLPEELIAAIYHFYLYDVLLMRRNNFAPVCTLFHRIASDPRSYNNLAIAIPCDASRSLRLASLLKRAYHKNPLYIDLTLQASVRDFSAPSTDLQPILQYAPRLKRLAFTIRGFDLSVLRDLRRPRRHVRLDALETFALEIDNVHVREKYYIPLDGEAFKETLAILRTATALKKFRISIEYSGDCDLTGVLINNGLRNLRFLFIHTAEGSFDMDTASIVGILHNCPYLTTFACTLCPRSSGTPANAGLSQNQIVNRYLTSFELHITGSHNELILVPTILDLLTLRHLNTFNVTWAETRNEFKRATVRALSRLVARSRCSLQSLTLRGVRTNAPEFYACLGSAMQQLTLRNGEDGERTILGGAGAGALLKAGYDLSYGSQRTQVFVPRRHR